MRLYGRWHKGHGRCGNSAYAPRKVAGVPVAHGMTSFVWSLMGQDANQPLDEIIIRKEEPETSFGGALARPSETASSR